MNQGIKNELSAILAITAGTLFLSGKKKAAIITAGISTATKFIPSRRYSFKGKSVVITGGSRGLGLSLAENFLREGAKVTVLARDHEELNKVTAKLNAIFAVPCDLTDAEQLKTAFTKIRNRFGAIDVLVNNAGAISVGPVETMDMHDFVSQMKIHWEAPLRAIFDIVPEFRKLRLGKIINISSIGGKIPVPHLTPYCASKFALAGLSHSLAAELAKDGIEVLTVYPGLMRTGSPIQAVFKGNHQKEFAWFALGDLTPGLSISATRAARQIIKAAKQRRSQLTITLPAKTAALGFSLFPELFNGALKGVNQLLPQGSSKYRRTGAASRDLFEGSLLTLPFRALEGKAKRRFNQKEHFDGNKDLH